MKKFIYSYPTKVYFGEGMAKVAIDEEMASAKRVMLAYGSGSIKKNGIYEKIRGHLLELGKDVIDFGGIMPNPTYTKAKEGAALARKEYVDFILAVGGGSVIDCAKVISIQALTDEDVWTMKFEKGLVPISGIPVGAIVTASGTGAEMNNIAVITHEEKMRKASITGTTPCFAVLDANLTATVPPIQVLSGAFDTLSHAMEIYFGSSDADNVSDDMCLAIMRNTVINMKRLLIDINDMQARSNLLWDSAMAENGILKIGREIAFQVHQIEHQLGAYTDCNHGQGLAVIHPVYYRHILADATNKFERFAKVVFDKDTGAEGVEALAAFIAKCGLPTKLTDLWSKVSIDEELLRKVANTTNIVEFAPRKIDHDEIFDILMECM